MPEQSADLAAAQRFVDAFVDDLRALVNIDSGTYTPEGVARVAELLRPKFIDLGCTVEIHPGQRLGPLLVARRRGEGRRRILLIGHMDTVFPGGEAERRPFRTADGLAYGPGVADMKSGLLVGLYAVRLLADAGGAPYASLTVLYNSDEEVGSPESSALVRELAGQADAAIVLEPAHAPDEVTVTRKGVALYTLQVEGVAAHAGVEPEKGHNAILELAHRIVALQALNGTVPGVTLNVGKITGGERGNVVPDRAEALFDVRAPTADAARAIEEEIRRVCDAPTVPGTALHLSGGFIHQPFEQSPASKRLFEHAQAAAAPLGLSLRGIATGGGSDGNTAAALGVPTLDGMGLSGGQTHHAGEWARLDDIPRRVALLADLLRRFDAAADA